MNTKSSKSASGCADIQSINWTLVKQSLVRPYPVTVPMMILVLLIPGYLVIANLTDGRTAHVPSLPLDVWIPVVPAWVFVYGTVYLFLIILPVFVVQRQALVNRVVNAYLMVWILSFAGFLLYPTIAPRPEEVTGDGFAAWGLQFLYRADPPYNCFPSLHVAHSFVSALACYRVHKGVGLFAVVCAALVAISTLFTKQHYVADVIVGILLAFMAYVIFLHRHSRSDFPETESRLAPALAALAGAIVGVVFVVFWMAYQLTA